MRWTKTELALAAIIPATVFAFAMGSSSVTSAVTLGTRLRWAMLFLLAGVAVVYGWSNRRHVPRALAMAAGGLAAVAFLSTTWSVMPRITAERALTLAVLLTAAAFVSAGTRGSRRRTELVLTSLVVGPTAVALAGVLLLVFDHRLAVQGAGPRQPARLQGFGQNPNTVSMLLALVLPIAIWGIVVARTTPRRAVWFADAALLYGSVVASGSRGAMLASAAGTIVFVAVWAV
jgi:hypothetical protein